MGKKEIKARSLKKTIWKFSRTRGGEREIPVVCEETWKLYVGQRTIITFFCLGSFLEELAVGYLRNLDILKNPYDVKKITLSPDESEIHVELAPEYDMFIRSFCGGSSNVVSINEIEGRKNNNIVPLRDNVRIKPQQIFKLMEELNERSNLYKATHGVHNSALATRDGIIIFRDDIGRHNTIDMLSGYSFMKKIPLGDKIIVTTCRITSLIIQKVIRMGVPIIVSHGIATSLAMSLAERANITIVGFLRGYRFVVYTGVNRISKSGG